MRIPLLSKIFRSRASPKNSMWGSAYTFFFGTTSSGKTVNERTAMQNLGKVTVKKEKGLSKGPYYYHL